MSDLEFIKQGQSNYCRISSLLAVLSFEAYINYVGSRKILNWRERKPWHDKLKLILDKHSSSDKLEKEPFSALAELFEYRNQFAHGKIEVNEHEYLDYGHGVVEGDHRGDPKWYKDFGTDEQAEKTRRIIREAMLAIHNLVEPNDPRKPWDIFGEGHSEEVR